MSRWSIAQRTGRRGAGLGNEMFALAKAQIGARTLRAVLVEQPWWLNPRRYGGVMGRNVLLPLQTRVRGALYPRLVIDRSKVPNIWDYEESMTDLASHLPRAFQVIHASGMVGGYLGIRSAKGFLQQRLSIPDSKAPSSTLRVGVHLRAGDFATGQVRPGAWNVRLPSSWAAKTVSQLAEVWAGPVELIVHTDAPSGDGTLRDFERVLAPGLEPVYPRGDVLRDLRSLAACDVIVPSVSSFSMLAIFLSDAKYVWPREGLTERNGWLSLWGHEEDVAKGPTARAVKRLEEGLVDSTPRGLPLGQGAMPDIAAWLHGVPRSQDGRWPAETDLIYYGAAQAAS